jgi:hypothetical protein
LTGGDFGGMIRYAVDPSILATGMRDEWETAKDTNSGSRE